MTMARRKSQNKTRTVYRNRGKSYSRRTGTSKKGWGGLLAGGIAGAGGTLLRKVIPVSFVNYSQPAADILTGWYMKNETLQVIGGRTIGAMLVSGMNTQTSSPATPLLGGI
jgi:hypothetical protein